MLKKTLVLWGKYKNSWLANKYILLLTAFSVFVLFFDANSTIKRWGVEKENKNLKREIRKYEEQMAQDSATIEVLMNSPENLEQHARERYNMRKDNEDIYIIEE